MDIEAPYGISDPFTQEFSICDPDGVVRRGAMWHGTDYQCTNHAHFGGEHIRCTTPIHGAISDDELSALENPRLVLTAGSPTGRRLVVDLRATREERDRWFRRAVESELKVERLRKELAQALKQEMESELKVERLRTVILSDIAGENEDKSRFSNWCNGCSGCSECKP